MAGRGNKVQHFKAVLEKDSGALGWTTVRVPFAPSAVWPRMVRQRVRGTVNGVPFRTSLFPVAATPGAFTILVNRRMQTDAGVREGSRAEFTLEPDLEPRPAELPEELDALLDEAHGLRNFYESLSEYMRREIGKWIGGAKGEEARLRRGQQMAERLLSTMEAEQELPPLVERAFRERPRARAGWAKTSPTCRRTELFALFYYRTPESQEKRLKKLCEAAEKRAGAA